MSNFNQFAFECALDELEEIFPELSRETVMSNGVLLERTFCTVC